MEKKCVGCSKEVKITLLDNRPIFVMIVGI